MLSGFTVIGGTGQLSQGIRVEESSPTIENCIVRGGSPTADPGAWTHASGIYALNAGPTLSRCTITGSSNADAWFSAGITLEGATDFSVSDSTITSGLATRATSGVSMTDGSKGSMTAVSISSSPSELSQGVTVEGGSDLSIGDSTISAGGGATKVARGINLNGSMLAAGGDNISAGPATVDSCGVFVDSDESWSVSKSKVVAGVASTSRGIAVNGGGGGAVDGSTVVSGGSGTTTSHAIYLHSGNSKVTNNTIVSGAGESAWGIFLDNVAAAWISDNRIFGGQGAVSFGIRAATNSSDWSSITRNLIYGGSGDYSVAVSLQATNAVVWNNLIHGGGGTAALPTLGTRGLEVQDGTVRIINNTIFSGGLTNSSFGIACVPAQPEIVNNIIFVGVDNEKAIFSSQTLTSAVQNNLFYAYSGTMQAYQDQESNYVYGINELSNFSNNISGDPAFLDTDGSDNDIMTAEDNDWHLSAATSLGVREGGIPVQLPDQFDLEQVRRTAPWSIGGYEYD